MENDRLDIILPHGGYRRLRSFQCAQLVYDGTVRFCERFVDRFSRTRDQMVQAARSGVQNIAEGSVSSATSKKTEIRLTSVARASIEELLLDYEDFLRQRGLDRWDKDSPEALAVRARFRLLSDRFDASDLSDPYGLKSATAEVAANTLICLANQASFLLGRQIIALERRFMEEGGFSERLHRARRAHRT
jgi:four helix bundle suffix protein